MRIFGRATGFERPPWAVQILISLLSLGLLFTIWPQSASAHQDAPPPQQAAPQAAPAPPYTQQTPDQLQQLVAPIALYPDSLVAQILAASTFPDQVVEADRWVQAHPGLQGEPLGQAVDQQPWDPSVKALTAFPIGPGKYGQEPLLDVVSRRRLLQPATGCDGRHPGDAPTGARSRQSSDYAAASGNDARADGRHSACQS